MKKVVLLFLLLQFSLPAVFGQTATFSADSTLLRRYAGGEHDFNKAMQMQWLINGKPLSYGSDTVHIVANPQKLDTVLFRMNDKKGWDTIICNIAEPKSYNFTLNVCCGGFDVQHQKRRVPMKVEVSVKGKSDKMYLARLEETGKVISGSGKVTITPTCRSAMKPNIFWVMLQEVEVCTDTGNCEKNEEFCLQNENNEADYSFSYKVKKTIAKFLYAPLGNKPLRISYKPEKNKLKIK